ncbi:transposase [Micromonospora globispora]|uniref:Transposase n=1 Tax=Micromonospora globispora TaxID=1450148 RepID=A0A317JT51_9ACTN|nr:RNA-guided endonuclease TnpB family protein [Micromonospora globispora]PWU43530.1 transposase [Micromonospora globispora]PWU58675.1 transposase [Micromonospora globispora]RQW94604.1 transposase [Micromonospora globispora]
MSRVKQGYRVELAPTAKQRSRLAQHAGLSRVVENFCLALVKAALDQREAERSYGVPDELLTPVPWSAPALEKAWRAAHSTLFPWFGAEGLSSRVPKEACRVRAAGLKNWAVSRTGVRRGRRVGFPTWRKRKHGSRFRYDADRAHPTGPGMITLPGVGPVRTREDMSWLTGRLAYGCARIIGATVREQAGRWWVSFQVDIDRSDIDQRRAVAADAPTCGIDLGLTTFAVVADDSGVVEEVHPPRALKAAQRKLRRANKALARCRTGSSNRAKAARKLAAVHLAVSHRRADFLHQLTTRLARTKRAIAVESLNVAGMVRNRRLARAVSDAGFAEFIRQLEYKAGWYGSKVWAADRWYPSSKMCGDCGVVNAELTLSDRVWTCQCGTLHNRDRNAARNLLAAMHSTA